jgi:hypothetical protein
MGWHRVGRLENGIEIWERADVDPLPGYVNQKHIPRVLKLMWGLIPMLCLCFALYLNFQQPLIKRLAARSIRKFDYAYQESRKNSPSSVYFSIQGLWILAVLGSLIFLLWSWYENTNPYDSPENCVLAYYDDIDFKRYKESFEKIKGSDDYSLAQYLLELSVSDGLLGSYCKLDNITFEQLSSVQDSVYLKANLSFVSPLGNIQRTAEHLVIKQNGKWLIAFEPKKFQAPQNLFTSQSGVSFGSHGRRNLDAKKTHHQDLLARPKVDVTQVNLLNGSDGYSVTGIVQNVDAIPADLNVKALLYGKVDGVKKLIAKTAVGKLIKHKILPGAYTPFQCNFDSLDWVESGIKPTSIELQVLSTATTHDLYDMVSVSIRENAENLEIKQFNYGRANVTIPGILGSVNNEGRVLKVWLYTPQQQLAAQREQQLIIEKPKVEEKFLPTEEVEVWINGKQKKLANNNFVAAKQNSMKDVTYQFYPINYIDDLRVL